MISSIQIHEETKRSLERFKEDKKQSYEEVIEKLIEQAVKRENEREQLLIEGYKEMAQDSLQITKEWESSEEMLEWEW